MFGFLFGAACLAGLFAVGRRGHGHGHGYWGGHGHWGRRGWGRGWGHPGFSPLRSVLDRLDTTPGQEKEIRTAIDELMEEARSARRDFRGAREDVARVIREAEIPEGAFESLIQRQDETLARLRQAGQRAFRKIHETLDARQRDLLANLVESWGPGFFWSRTGC
jgi:Spy/CpxP family protein refolding chaperone